MSSNKFTIEQEYLTEDQEQINKAEIINYIDIFFIEQLDFDYEKQKEFKATIQLSRRQMCDLKDYLNRVL